MNAKEFSEEMMALLEGSLPDAKKEEVLAVLNEDEELQRHLMAHVLLQQMFDTPARELHSASTAAPHVDNETLETFLENGFAADANERIKAHVRVCPTCFWRMAVLKKAMTEWDNLRFPQPPTDLIEKAKRLSPVQEKVVNEAEPVSAPKSASILDFVRDVIEKLKIRLVVAVAIIVLFMLLLPRPSVRNISLGDQLVISSSSNPFGFTSKPEIVEYKGMMVKLSQDNESLIFTWLPVQNASFYEIYLIENENKRQITPQGGILQNTYSFPKREIKIGTKYVWELTGKMKDEKEFAAKAEFVCKK